MIGSKASLMKMDMEIGLVGLEKWQVLMGVRVIVRLGIKE